MEPIFMSAAPPLSRRAAWRRRWMLRLAALLALVVLLLVFSLYTQPDLVQTLAEQLWACF